MMEVIQPDRSSETDGHKDARSRGLNSAAASGAHTTFGSTTAESQQHLKVDGAEYEGKDEQKTKKKSVVGKVKEKAKKLKSKVKKGLKIGSNGKNEEPNAEEEGYSSDSESEDDEDQQPAARQEGMDLDEKPVHQILEQNPQFNRGGNNDKKGELSLSDLVAEWKKPITPFKTDGPKDALQAVPTQYSYHDQLNICDGTDSGKLEGGRTQEHQGSAKGGLDLSNSFLGAISSDQLPHGAAFDSKSGSEESGPKPEAQVEKVDEIECSDEGKEEDLASDERNEGEESKGDELENHEPKESLSADSEPQAHSSLEHGEEEESSQSVDSLEGKVLPKFEAALSKEENQKPSFVSEAQSKEGEGHPDSDDAAARDDSKERVLPNSEGRKAESDAAARDDSKERVLPNSEGRKAESIPLEPSGDDKQSDQPLDKMVSESGEAFGIGEVSQSGYEADADSNLASEGDGTLSMNSQELPDTHKQDYTDSSAQELPSQTSATAPSEQSGGAIPLSQRAFGGLSSAKDKVADATSSVVEAVGSSLGFYSHPDSTHHQSPGADMGADGKSKSEQSGSESAGGQDPATDTRRPAHESEDGRGSSWSEWLSESVAPAKELLISTFGAKSENGDGENHLDNGTNVETQDPLRQRDPGSHEGENGAGDQQKVERKTPEEPHISANSKSLPEVLAFPPQDPQADSEAAAADSTAK